MSSFPQHVDNINRLKKLGVDVSEYTKDGEVTLESWSYDSQVYLLSDVIDKLANVQAELNKKGE